MTSKTLSHGIVRAVLLLIGIGSLAYFLYAVQSVIIYLFISLLLTLIGSPIVNFLKTRFKFKNTVAVITVLALYIIILLGFLLLFVPLVIDQSQKMALLDTNAIQQNYTLITGHIESYLASKNINASEFLQQNSIGSYLSFIPNFINSLIGTLGSFGVGFASVLFITFFFLKDRLMFRRIFLRIIPDSYESEILNSLSKIHDMLSRYFTGLVLQLSIIFVLYLIVLLIFGIENALIIALICAVLNIVPYVGPLIALVLAAILTLTNNINTDFATVALPKTLYVIIGFFVVQLIDNNISSPIIFSKSTKSHPLEIFLVILIAGILMGIVGMIVAVPLYTSVKLILKEFFPDNRFIQLFTKNL